MVNSNKLVRTLVRNYENYSLSSYFDGTSKLKYLSQLITIILAQLPSN